MMFSKVSKSRFEKIARRWLINERLRYRYFPVKNLRAPILMAAYQSVYANKPPATKNKER